MYSADWERYQYLRKLHRTIFGTCKHLDSFKRNVELRKPYLRTLAESVGAFDGSFTLKQRLSLEAAKEWAKKLSCPLGVWCDKIERGDVHAERLYAGDVERHLVGTLVRPVTEALLQKYDAIATLVSSPQAFAFTIDVSHVAKTTGGACMISLNVAVALRPLAFIARTPGQEIKLPAIRSLLNALEVPNAADIVDQRDQPSLPIASLPHRHDFPTRGAERAKQMQGALVNLVLDAVEKSSTEYAEEADVPPGLLVPQIELRCFQRKALKFMHDREDSLPSDITDVTSPSSIPLWYGRGTFFFAPPARGGFLFQEMGCGKTLISLSLVLTRPRPLGSHGTLVLCPPTLLANWEAEMKKLLTGKTSFFLLTSNSMKKVKKDPEVLSKYDIVVSAFTILKNSPVLNVQWHRLILDECQQARACGASDACHSIRAIRRWGLSGTPMPKEVLDLKGQLHALQMAPWDRLFNTRLLPKSNSIYTTGRYEAFQMWQSGHRIQPLVKFLASCSIRHTKSAVGADGEAFVKLPALTVTDHLIDASDADLAAYLSLKEGIDEKVAVMMRSGAISYKVFALNSLLLQLRMACDHASLAKEAVERLKRAAVESRARAAEAGVAQATLDELIKAARGDKRKIESLTSQLSPYVDPLSGAIPECPICLDEMLTPTVTGTCELPHVFCLACLLESMRNDGYERRGRCPLCRESIFESDLRTLKIAPVAGDSADAVGSPTSGEDGGGARCEEAQQDGAMDESIRSSKLDALAALLHTDLDAHPQSIVFVQFKETLKLVTRRLAEEGIRYETIVAGCSQAHRAKSIRSFTSDPSVRVFVLSMASAAVGLTLTCASRCILLEPGTSVAQEAQAIGRIHRFGQERPCVAVRMGLKGTVEEKILDMTRGAPHASDASGGSGDGGGGGSSAGPSSSAAGGGGGSGGGGTARAAQTALTSEQLVRLLR